MPFFLAFCHCASLILIAITKSFFCLFSMAITFTGPGNEKSVRLALHSGLNRPQPDWCSKNAGEEQDTFPFWTGQLHIQDGNGARIGRKISAGSALKLYRQNC